ncbi:MAG: hypothetical protein ABIK28_18185 [Planctomycetota bacterium]
MKRSIVLALLLAITACVDPVNSQMNGTGQINIAAGPLSIWQTTELGENLTWRVWTTLWYNRWIVWKNLVVGIAIDDVSRIKIEEQGKAFMAQTEYARYLKRIGKEVSQ